MLACHCVSLASSTAAMLAPQPSMGMAQRERAEAAGGKKMVGGGMRRTPAVVGKGKENP